MSTAVVTTRTQKAWSKEVVEETVHAFMRCVRSRSGSTTYKRKSYAEIVSSQRNNLYKNHMYDFSRQLLSLSLSDFDLDLLRDYIASRPGIPADMPLDSQLTDAIEELAIQIFEHEDDRNDDSMTTQRYDEHVDHIAYINDVKSKRIQGSLRKW